MYKKRHFSFFLLFSLIASLAVVYFIALPFLGPLVLAAVFAFLFQPVYKRFLSLFRRHKSMASVATTCVAVILVLMPVVLLGTQFFREASHLYHSLATENGGVAVSLEALLNNVHETLPMSRKMEVDIDSYVRQVLGVLVSNLGSLFSSFAKTLLNVVVFMIAFYFFLKDGQTLKKYVVELSPLDDSDDEFIVSRLKSTVIAVVKGILAIGLIQGTLTGVGFAIFGVPNAVLWGSSAAVTSFLPGIGTSLVVLPGIAYLFLTGNIVGGIGLTLWGMIAVGLIDNLLGPKLIGRNMKLHPLAVFISVIGGLAFFGPLGFLLGPISMSVCVALIEIYFSLKAQSPKGRFF